MTNPGASWTCRNLCTDSGVVPQEDTEALHNDGLVASLTVQCSRKTDRFYFIYVQKSIVRSRSSQLHQKHTNVQKEAAVNSMFTLENKLTHHSLGAHTHTPGSACVIVLLSLECFSGGRSRATEQRCH